MVARWCSLSAGGRFRPKGGAWRGAVASGWSGGAGALKMRARGRAEKRAWRGGDLRWGELNSGELFRFGERLPRRTDASTGCAVARWNRSKDVVASGGSTWSERSSPVSSTWRSDATATTAASGWGRGTEESVGWRVQADAALSALEGRTGAVGAGIAPRRRWARSTRRARAGARRDAARGRAARVGQVGFASGPRREGRRSGKKKISFSFYFFTFFTFKCNLSKFKAFSNFDPKTKIVQYFLLYNFVKRS
jgi:hypothetical protein